MGSFSPEFRTQDNKMVRVGYTMATMEPVTEFVFPRKNSGPSYKDVRYTVKLSIPAEEPLGAVVLKDTKSGRTFECEDFEDVSVESTECTIAERDSLEEATYEVTVFNTNRDEEVGWGNFTHEPINGATCHRSEQSARLYCNATRRCVESCNTCKEPSMQSDGTVVLVNTSLVHSMRMCIVDVCPDDGSNARIFCPRQNSPMPCFTAAQTTAACRGNCHPRSIYNQEKDMCTIPCDLDISSGTGIKQDCATVVPGETCTIECLDGWRQNTGPATTTFTCPTHNEQEAVFSSGDPGYNGYPTCQETCAVVTCPSGWESRPATTFSYGSGRTHCCIQTCETFTCPGGYNSKPKTTHGGDLAHCCTEVVCPDGKYRNGLSCHDCNGDTRRRRATSCTNCATKHLNNPGADACREVTCGAGNYVSSGTLHCTACTTIVRRRRATSCTGCPSNHLAKANSDDCTETVCGAGYWVTSNRCTYCTGDARRRRANSCSGCAINYQNTHNADHCSVISSVSGYSKSNQECRSNGGTMPSGTHAGAAVTACASACSGRWDCGGFQYHYPTRSCYLKWLGHCSLQNSGAWNFFRKR